MLERIVFTLPLMAQLGPRGVSAREQQVVDRHDAVGPLVVDGRGPFVAELAVQERVAKGRSDRWRNR